MNTPTLSTEEEIAAAVQEELAKIREHRTSLVSDRNLTWLAMVPVWTERLAREAGFATEGKPLEEFLETAENLGLVVQEHPAEVFSDRIATLLGRSSEHQFWMPEIERSRVLASLRDRLGPSALLEEVRTIVSRLPPTTSIPALDEWHELAGLSAEGTSLAADRIRDRTRELLGRGETAAALRWLRNASLLAQTIGGQLESAVLRGQREVEVAYRRAHDRRALLGFLEREEQIRAFEDLVTGPDDFWALHFLGMGGAGKTMLIRHINAELAEKHERFTARVDFDYISPNYPMLRPEQLLVSLADELRAYSPPEDFARFEDSVRRLQEIMSESGPRSLTADPLESAEFKAVERAFSDWLTKLPRRVVLILDTCEELAKFQPAGGMAPSIRATYRILENLHAGNPSLRVIFAGRRPLALSGHGWRLRRQNLSEGQLHLPEEKDYLRLHLVRGFTADEGDEYFRRQGVQIAGRLRTTVLKNSLESPAIVDLIEGAEAGDAPRWNPFDLSLYAQWLREMPELTVEIIESGRTDPYIDLRIARRLTDSVQKLLPAVAFLGRFDETMLRPVGARFSDAEFSEVFRELAEQEWIDLQYEGTASFLQVDRNLHPRLLGYFEATTEQRSVFERARSQLAPALARLVRLRLPSIHPVAAAEGAGQPALNFELVYAALRALENGAALTLWQEIEERIIETGRWDWAGTISQRLLGEEDAGAIPDDLPPAIMATQTSAMVHTESGPAVLMAWENVLAFTKATDPPEPGEAVARRAWLGKLAASPPQTISPEDIDHLTRLWEGLEEGQGGGAYTFEQLTASLYAASERVIDGMEQGVTEGRLVMRDASASPADSLSPELRAFAYTLCSRLHRNQGLREEAAKAARHAVEIAGDLENSGGQRWAGWVAPESVRDFVKLEELLQVRWFDETQAPAVELIPQGLRFGRNLDSERLISLQVELQLGARLLTAPELEILEKADSYSGPSRAERAAHRAVLPLTVNVALGWLALGDSERALALLDARIQQAKEAGPDPEMIVHCERAKLKVVTRMRLRQRGEVLMERSLRAPELISAGWPARALNGLPPAELPYGSEPIPREQVHAWWRSRIGSDEKSRRVIGEEATNFFKRGTEDEVVPAAMLLADHAERDWYEAGRPPTLEEGESLDMLQRATEDARATAALPCRDLVRVDLRGASLRRSAALPSRDLIGRRRLAELALEEGELLSLRIPSLGLDLLGVAHENFAAVGDWTGALITAICAASAAQRLGRVSFFPGPFQLDGRSIEPPDRIVAKKLLTVLAARTLSEKARPAYERVRAATAPDLPSWDEMEALPGRPRSELRSLDHPVWGGWLHRLFWCLVADTPGDKKALVVWIARHYGEYLPEELGFSDTEKKIARKAVRASRGEDGVLRVFIISTLVFAVLVLTILLSNVARAESSAWMCLLVPAYSVVFYGLLITTIAKSIRSWRAARRPLVIAIEPGGQTSGGDVARRRPCLLHVFRGPRSKDIDLRIQAVTPGLGRYKHAVADLPFEVVDVLVEMRGRLLGNSWWNRMAVPIVAGSPLTAPAWEGIIWLGLPTPSYRTITRVLETGGRVIFLFLGLLTLSYGIVQLFSAGNTVEWIVGLISGLVMIPLALVSWRRRGKELQFYRGAPRRWPASQLRETWRSKRVSSVANRKWRLLGEQGLSPLVSAGFSVTNAQSHSACHRARQRFHGRISTGHRKRGCFVGAESGGAVRWDSSRQRRSAQARSSRDHHPGGAVDRVESAQPLRSRKRERSARFGRRTFRGQRRDGARFALVSCSFGGSGVASSHEDACQFASAQPSSIAWRGG
jgi:hypothetical protein